MDGSMFVRHSGSMDITVRPAQEGDAAQIAEAHVEAWRVGYRGIVADSYLDSDSFAAARRVGWCRLLARSEPDSFGASDHVYVPVVAGRVVGFGHVGAALDQPDGVGELHGFYVHPKFWGSGVADAIMARCLDDLRSRSDRAVLWTLRDAGRARRFYERSGWTCGAGSDLVEDEWPGPEMDGVPVLESPLAEVQYRCELQ